MGNAQTLAPTTGNDGRVINHENDTYLAGITEWKFTRSAGTIPIPHFEMSSDANGLPYPNKLRGVGDAKLTISGITNINPTDQTETGTTNLANGVYVTLDLVVSKTVAKGYQGVVGWVANFETGAKVGNEAQMFSCSIEVDGVPPEYGSITD